MRKKCEISSWEQLKHGDIIYKVPRFNIDEAQGYDWFVHNVQKSVSEVFVVDTTHLMSQLCCKIDMFGKIICEGMPDFVNNYSSYVTKLIGNSLVRRFIIHNTTENSFYCDIFVRDDKPSKTVTYNSHEYSFGRSNDLFINDCYSDDYVYTYSYDAYRTMLNDSIKEWENTFRKLRREVHSIIKNSKIRK